MSILKRLVEAERYLDLTRIHDTVDEDVLAHALKERRLTLTFNGATVHNIMKDACDKGMELTKAKKSTIKRAVFIAPKLYFAVTVTFDDKSIQMMYFEASKNSPGAYKLNQVELIPSSSTEVSLSQTMLPFSRIADSDAPF